MLSSLKKEVRIAVAVLGALLWGAALPWAVLGQTSEPLDSRVIETYNDGGNESVLDAPYVVKTRLSDPEAPEGDVDIFVADTANNRVIMFPKGSFEHPVYYPSAELIAGEEDGAVDLATTIAALESDNLTVDGKVLQYARTNTDRRLFKPMGLAICGGYICVSDSGNGRIVVLRDAVDGQTGETKLEFVWAFGYFINNGLIRDIEADSAGYVYVLDGRHGIIGKYQVDGRPIPFAEDRLIISGLTVPYDMTLDDDGNIYVTDTSMHQVVKYGPDGETIAILGQRGKEDDELLYPQGVAIDSENNIVVADTENYRIKRFIWDADLQDYVYDGYIGDWGDGEGEFFHNRSLTVGRYLDKSVIFAADTTLDRIQIFDLEPLIDITHTAPAYLSTASGTLNVVVEFAATTAPLTGVKVDYELLYDSGAAPVEGEAALTGDLANGGSFAIDLLADGTLGPLLGAGQHLRYRIVAAGSAATNSTKHYKVPVDVKPPAIDIAEPAANFEVRSDAAFDVVAAITDLGVGVDVADVTLQFASDAPFTPGASDFATGTGWVKLTYDASAQSLSEGPTAIEVGAIDGALNVATDSVLIIIDDTPPTVSITGTQTRNPAYLTNTGQTPFIAPATKVIGGVTSPILFEKARLMGTATDANGAAEYIVHAATGTTPQRWKEIEAFKEGDHSFDAGVLYEFDTNVLTDGIWTFAFKAADAAGNWSATQTIIVEVDNKKPTGGITKPYWGEAVPFDRFFEDNLSFNYFPDKSLKGITSVGANYEVTAEVEDANLTGYAIDALEGGVSGNYASMIMQLKTSCNTDEGQDWESVASGTTAPPGNALSANWRLPDDIDPGTQRVFLLRYTADDPYQRLRYCSLFMVWLDGIVITTNPTNGVMPNNQIEYSLSDTGTVSVLIYKATETGLDEGRLTSASALQETAWATYVKAVVPSERQLQGTQKAVWDGTNYSGVEQADSKANNPNRAVYYYLIRAVNDAGFESFAFGTLEKVQLPKIEAFPLSGTGSYDICFKANKAISQGNVALTIYGDDSSNAVLKSFSLWNYNRSSYYGNYSYCTSWNGLNSYNNVIELRQRRMELTITDALGNTAQSVSLKDMGTPKPALQPLYPISLRKRTDAVSNSGTAEDIFSKGTKILVSKNVDPNSILSQQEKSAIALALRPGGAGGTVNLFTENGTVIDPGYVIAAATQRVMAENVQGAGLLYQWDGRFDGNSSARDANGTYDFSIYNDILQNGLHSIQGWSRRTLYTDVAPPQLVLNDPTLNGDTMALTFNVPSGAGRDFLDAFQISVYDLNKELVTRSVNDKDDVMKAPASVSGGLYRQQWPPLHHLGAAYLSRSAFKTAGALFEVEGRDVAGNVGSVNRLIKFAGDFDADSGAIVISDDGMAMLRIPAHSVTSGHNYNDFAIAENQPTQGQVDLLKPGVAFIGKSYDFGPSGAEFNPPAQLRIYYTSQNGYAILDGGAKAPESTLSVVYYNPVTLELKRIGGVRGTEIDAAGKFRTYIRVPISHLSKYLLIGNTDYIRPIAKLTSPSPYYYASYPKLPAALHSVLGYACANDLAGYSLEYGEGVNPNQWTVIVRKPETDQESAPTPICLSAGAFLGFWDAKELSGDYTLKLSAWDLTGNLAKYEIVVTINADELDPDGDDTTAPSITINSTWPTYISHNYSNSSNYAVTLSYSLSEAANVTIRVLDEYGFALYTVQENEAKTKGAQQARYFGEKDRVRCCPIIWAPDGKARFEVTAEDAAGNSDTAYSRWFIIDATAPDIDVTFPASDQRLTDKNFTLTADIDAGDGAPINFYYVRVVCCNYTQMNALLQSLGVVAAGARFNPDNFESLVDSIGTLTYNQFLSIANNSRTASYSNGTVEASITDWGSGETNRSMLGEGFALVTAQDYATNNKVVGRRFTRDAAQPVITNVTKKNQLFSPVESYGRKDSMRLSASILEESGFYWRLDVFDENNQSYIVDGGYEAPSPDGGVVSTTIQADWTGDKRWRILDDSEYPPQWRYAYAQLPDGAHRLKLSALDGQGNVNYLFCNVLVDNASPAISDFTQSAEYAKYGVLPDVQYSAQVTEQHPEKYEWVVYDHVGVAVRREETALGPSPAASQTVTFDWDGYDSVKSQAADDGLYVVSLIVYDAAGNYAVKSSTVIVDGQAPVIADVDVENDGYFSITGNSAQTEIAIAPEVEDDSPFTWTFEVASGTVYDEGSWSPVYAYAGGASVFSASIGKYVADTTVWAGEVDAGGYATDGLYLYAIKATDDQSNVSAVATGAIVIDSIYPTVTALLPTGSYGARNIVFRASATDDLSGIDRVRLFKSQENVRNSTEIIEPFYSSTDTYSFTWVTDDQLTDIGYTDDGIYQWHFAAFDKAGNYDTTPSQRFTANNAPANITNIIDYPDPFSPDGSAGVATSSIYFGITREFDTVPIFWRMDIERETATGTQLLYQYPVSSPFASGTFAAATGVNELLLGPFEWSEAAYGSTIETATYSYTIYASAPNVITIASGTIEAINTNPVIDGFTASLDVFTPNADFSTDTVQFGATVTLKVPFDYAFQVYCNPVYSDACIDEYGADTLLWEVEGSYIPRGTRSVYLEQEWDGLTGAGATNAGALVPDGVYMAKFVVNSQDGDFSAFATDSVAKDNPIVTTAWEGGQAVSPNSDGVKDSVDLVWSASEAGYFDIVIYGLGDSSADTKEVATNVYYPATGIELGATQSVAWDGIWASSAATDGLYVAQFNGKDAVSVDPDGVPFDNFGDPASSLILVDTTAPTLSLYYATDAYSVARFPYASDATNGDVYTNLSPMFKVDATDELSGFGEDESVSLGLIEIELDGDDVNLLSATSQVTLAWSGDSQKTVRASIQPSSNLSAGEHSIKAIAEDIAGNSTQMTTAFDFVAVEPFDSKFASESAFVKDFEPIIYVEDASTGTVNLSSNEAHLTHINKTGSSASDIVAQGSQARMAGAYDLRYMDFAVEADVTAASGTGAYWGAGLYLADIEDGVESNRHAIAYADGKILTTDPIAGDYEAATGALPINLKLSKKDGILTYYADNVPLYSVETSFATATAGLFAESGFDGAAAVQSQAGALFDNFTTTIARPVINSVELINIESGASATQILLDEESYKITAEGTPWQRTVKGWIINSDRLSASRVDDPSLLVGSVFNMTESPAGSGHYESVAASASYATDAAGIAIGSYLAVVANNKYAQEPALGVNYATSTQALQLKEEIILSAVLSNETAIGSGYINEGDVYKVTVTTDPGDWNLRGFIQSENDSDIAGPFELSLESTGTYVFEGVLSDLVDADGATATVIKGLVAYGPLGADTFAATPTLSIGAPALSEFHFENYNRPTAADLRVGEIISLRAYADSGATLTAYILDQNEDVIESLPLDEIGDGAGIYALQRSTLLSAYEDNQASIGDMQAYVSDAGSGETLYASGAISLLPRAIAPKAPEKLILASVDGLPDLNATATALLSWTPPTERVDDTALGGSLAGFNLYRVGRRTASGAITLPASSPALVFATASGGLYDLSASALEYLGDVYNDSQMAVSGAGWFGTDSALLTALPSSTLANVDPLRDVYAYLVSMEMTDLYYATGTWKGTVFTQRNDGEVNKWINDLIDYGIIDQGEIVTSGRVFESNGDGSYQALGAIEPYALYTYEKVNDDYATQTYANDAITFADADWRVPSYAATAVDQDGQESAFSNIASAPSDETNVLAFSIANASSYFSTDYIETGDDLIMEIESAATGPWSLELHVINAEAAQTGISFASSVIAGPAMAAADPLNALYQTRTDEWTSFTDAASNVANIISGTLTVKDREEEIFLSENTLTKGPEPISYAHLINDDRPGQINVAINETVEITATATVGLDLRAQLINPLNVGTATYGLPIDIAEVVLTESPASSGLYIGTALLDTATDTTGVGAELIAAIVYASGSESNAIPAYENLSLMTPLQIDGDLESVYAWIESGNLQFASYTLRSLNASQTADIVDLTLSITDMQSNALQTHNVEYNYGLIDAEATSTFEFAALTATAGAYLVDLTVTQDGYQLFNAADSFEVVDVALAGALEFSTDTSYLLGQSIYATYSVSNLTDFSIADLQLEAQLINEATGTLLQSYALPEISQLSATTTQTATGVFNLPQSFDVPNASDTYKLQLQATLHDEIYDLASEGVIVAAPSIIITGAPTPATCNKNQEVYFNYTIENKTLYFIGAKNIKGEIVKDGGDPTIIYATFEQTVENLTSRQIQSKTGIFSPMLGGSGDYLINIYVQDDSLVNWDFAYQTTLTGADCGS